MGMEVGWIGARDRGPPRWRGGGMGCGKGTGRLTMDSGTDAESFRARAIVERTCGSEMRSGAQTAQRGAGYRVAVVVVSTGERERRRGEEGEREKKKHCCPLD